MPALEQLTELATQAGGGSAAAAEEAIHKVRHNGSTCNGHVTVV